MKKLSMTLGITVISVLALSAIVLAAIGDLLDTVGLPGNPSVSVGGTFDGTYYMTTGYNDNQIDIYLPPAPDAVPGLPADNATLVSSKTVLDAADGVTPVVISALAWDPTRGKLWGAYDDEVWLIDIGDPTVSGNALATFQFSPSAQAPGEVGPHPSGLPGISLVDGLAYDTNDDSIWYSPDVHNNVYHFASDGTYLGKVTPKDANGLADGSVSGVAVGSGNTLYIGRNGFAEIRRIDKTTGDFISTFATTAGRVEDLTCDPVTYAPNEAILAKDAYNGLYEAFEVEEGTCPLPKPSKLTVYVDIKPGSCPNPLNKKSKGVIPVAILGTEDFDVTTIDPATIMLNFGEGAVAPIRWNYEDVATPFEGEECECHELGPDGFMDLTLKFDTPELVDNLFDCTESGDTSLIITGNLLEEFDGTQFEGTDCVRI